jgi:hypothetical protein
MGWMEVVNGCNRTGAKSRLPPTASLEVDTLTQLALLAGAGLLVSFALMSYGLDLSTGFF